MTEIRRRKQSKEVAGQCNRTEETLIQSNETGLTGETLDQNSPTEESSIQRDQAGEAVKRRRMTPLFSPITGEVRDEESEGGDGWDWAMDFDPSRTDVGGVEASFCGILGMSDSEGCALGDPPSRRGLRAGRAARALDKGADLAGARVVGDVAVASRRPRMARLSRVR